MKGYIYKHTSPSGKSYIGQTYQKIDTRWRGGKGYKACTLLNRAVEKYGWENFSHEIIDEINFVDIKVLNQLEEKYIIELNTLSPNGYNLKTFGDNKLVSKETRDRNREATLIQFEIKGHPMQGKKHTEEAKKNMSLASMGQIAWNKGKAVWSDEEKKRISETTQKQFAEKGHPWDNKKQSDEAKRKMSIAWEDRRKKLLKQSPVSKRESKSGYRGVYWCKQKNKWVATIEVEKKTKHLGTSTDKNDAIDIRKQAELKYWDKQGQK